MDSLQEFLKPQLIWLVVGVFLLVMELFLPGLIIVFFGMGACIVGVLCFFTEISLNTQLLIFLISSLLLLLCLRKYLRGIFIGFSQNKNNMEENLQDFLGERAVVIAAIAPNLPGKVEFHGSNWQAAAEQAIEPGVPVQIIGKENLTLKVKPLG